MTEQDLDNTDVDSLFKKLRGKTVPEHMRRECRVQKGFVSRGPECFADRGTCHMIRIVMAGKNPDRMFALFPDGTEHVEYRLRQRENSLLVPLADDPDDHVFRVDVLNTKADRLLLP